MQPASLRARSLLAASLVLFALPARSQDARVSTDPEREVLVMFQPGVVTSPAGRVAGPVAAFSVTSPAVLDALTAAGVEAVVEVVPGFKPEDRFVTNPTGESVELTDWSRVFLLRTASPAARQPLIGALAKLPEVVYAEPNYPATQDHVVSYVPLAEPPFPSAEHAALLTPNDEFFSQQWGWLNTGQGGGQPGADVDAPEAWDITTGSSGINIAIVEVGGMQTSHFDFSGRATGDAGTNDGHGTAVAGIAAATGNNTEGVAGMAWAGGIINENLSASSVAATLLSATNRGAKRDQPRSPRSQQQLVYQRLAVRQYARPLLHYGQAGVQGRVPPEPGGRHLTGEPRDR